MSAFDKYHLEYVKVTVHPDGVAHVELNRPKSFNAFNDGLIRDILAAFTALSDDQDVRAIVLSGSGRMFSVGLDLKEIQDRPADLDNARRTYLTRHHLKWFQNSITSLEECSKPIISVIHSNCIGAGVDLITACDIRYASKDATFCVKEVDVGIAADVGSLQRLPKVIGNQSLVRELCLTARNMYADEALQSGLVSRVEDTKEKALEEAFKVARNIASKSPVAIVGTKHLLNYSRDRTTADGLAYTVAWSSAMLNTDDIPLSINAFMTKKPAKYAKL